MCTVAAYRQICVFDAKRGKSLGEALPFPPFLSLIHILPICFDSAQVLYIYLFNSAEYLTASKTMACKQVQNFIPPRSFDFQDFYQSWGFALTYNMHKKIMQIFA
jgi:hypothetical protein